MKFKKGSTVVIINAGDIYDGYEKMAGLLQATKWKSEQLNRLEDYRVMNGKKATLINTCEYGGYTYCLIELKNEEQYIIGENAIKLIKGTYDLSSIKVYEAAKFLNNLNERS